MKGITGDRKQHSTESIEPQESLGTDLPVERLENFDSNVYYLGLHSDPALYTSKSQNYISCKLYPNK